MSDEAVFRFATAKRDCRDAILSSDCSKQLHVVLCEIRAVQLEKARYPGYRIVQFVKLKMTLLHLNIAIISRRLERSLLLRSFDVSQRSLQQICQLLELVGIVRLFDNLFQRGSELLHYRKLPLRTFHAQLFLPPSHLEDHTSLLRLGRVGHICHGENSGASRAVPRELRHHAVLELHVVRVRSREPRTNSSLIVPVSYAPTMESHDRSTQREW